VDAGDCGGHAIGQPGNALMSLVRPSGRAADPVLALVLAIVAYAAGVGYLRGALARGLKPEFYQFEFGPAVMLVCGHGFVAPAQGTGVALHRLLNPPHPSPQS